jgi:5'-nucleotidase
MQRLVVYHTSDIHSARGFGDRLAALVEPGSLLVDCGDALAGSSVFYRRHEPVIGELAKAPYAAMAVGNREFHYLHAWFSARARRLAAPLVCSNLIDLRARPPVFSRELQLDRAGIRVRVLGLVVPQYRTNSGWEKFFGWRFLAPQVALAEFGAANGGAQSADAAHSITIVLSHLGLAQDEQLASRFGGLGAIFGGHTHDALGEPRLVNAVPIMHPGAHAAYVGRAEFRVNGCAVTLADYRLVPLLAA